MKRLITFLVSIAVLLNIMVPAVLSQEAQSLYSNTSFSLLESLEIDSGINPDPAAFITRAEFAAMAVRAVNMDEYASYDGGFDDVPANHKFVNEIYTARNLKMSNGTSEGIFSPDDNINIEAALKMIIVAMGYENMAVTLGGYPIGYRIIDSKLDLTDGISSNDYLTVYDAKLIVTNALKEDAAIFSGIKNGDLMYQTNSGVNLLTERFGLTSVTGVVTKAGYLALNGVSEDDNRVTIGSNTYECIHASESYFGTEVKAWVGVDDSKIYALESTGNSRTVLIDAQNIIAHSNNTLTVYEENKTKTYKTDRGLSFFENGVLISHNDSDFVFSDGSLKLIDSDNDGTYDYAIAEKTEKFIVTGINIAGKIIYDKNSPTGYIELEEDNGKIILITDALGNRVEFSELKKDMVLELACSMDAEKRVNIIRILDSKKLNMAITEIGDDIIFAGETAYPADTYLKRTLSKLSPGDECEFYITADGTAVFAQKLDDGAAKYGFYLAMGKTSGLNAEVMLKILTESNSVEEFTLSDKITLDGEKNVSPFDIKLTNKLMNGEFYKYQLIRYALNSEGKLDMIDTAQDEVNETWERNENEDTENKLTQYLDGESVNYRGGSYFGAPAFSFTGGVIFVAPDALRTTPNAVYNEKAFEVTDISTLENNDTYKVDIFDFDEYYYPQAIIVYKDTTGATVSADNSTQLVYSVTEAVNDDGDETKLIRTYSEGLYYRYYVAPEKLGELTIPNPGDIVRFSTDHNGYINNISVDVAYDKESKTADIKFDGAYTGRISYISGKVKNIGNGSLVLRATEYPKALPNTSNIAPLPLGYTPDYAVFDVTKGTVTRAAIEDILTEELAGTAVSDFVVCRLNYYAATDIIIYRN